MNFKGFTLDKFQEEAIEAIMHNKSVVVSAPTGSGKTLIADYIIFKELGEGKRVIYTAPIKALSNQKYRDFCDDHGKEKIGIMTGDVVINPNAPILIMTTEVYRNMVLVNDPTVHNISYVIFDEIHFINDPERGYVWEESVIFSPEHVRFLCLSATIPNSEEFASWIKAVKKHSVVVVKHHIRPVPLKHYYFDTEYGLKPMEQLDLVEEVYNIPEYSSRRGRRRRPRMEAPSHIELIKMLNSQNELPILFFVFSRGMCMEKAEELWKKMDFIRDKRDISSLISKEFSSLKPELQQLKSTRLLRRLLSKGIAFHHAGVLPALKHIVERFFSQGLIKVLYATETFAVGINMPAKAVVFNSFLKYDGIRFRLLNSKEYFQLAGRAGRRGIDTHGKSIILLDRQWFNYKWIKSVTSKDTDPIKSQFQLSYNTVLNLIKMHNEDEILKIISSSFFSYQQFGEDYNKKVNIGIVKRQFTTKRKRLAAMGYVQNDKLTWKGEFATHIFSDELAVSEVFGTDLWQELNEYQMLMVLAALSYEPRRGIRFYQTNNDSIRKLYSVIGKHGFLNKDKRFREFEKLSSIIWPMYHGQDFAKVLKNTNMMEGNMIRFFRQIVDRIGQIKNANIPEQLKYELSSIARKIDEFLKGVFEI